VRAPGGLMKSCGAGEMSADLVLANQRHYIRAHSQVEHDVHR
jgi:hypothetical protein